MSSRLDHVIQRITAHPRAQHERIIALLESVKLEEDRIEQEHQRVTSSPSPALKLAPETISHILSYLDDRISSVFTGWGRRYGKLSGLAGASLIGRQWAEQARLQRWHTLVEEVNEPEIDGIRAAAAPYLIEYAVFIPSFPDTALPRLRQLDIFSHPLEANHVEAGDLATFVDRVAKHASELKALYIGGDGAYNRDWRSTRDRRVNPVKAARLSAQVASDILPHLQALRQVELALTLDHVDQELLRTGLASLPRLESLRFQAMRPFQAGHFDNLYSADFGYTSPYSWQPGGIFPAINLPIPHYPGDPTQPITQSVDNGLPVPIGFTMSGPTSNHGLSEDTEDGIGEFEEPKEEPEMLVEEQWATATWKSFPALQYLSLSSVPWQSAFGRCLIEASASTLRSLVIDVDPGSQYVGALPLSIPLPCLASLTMIFGPLRVNLWPLFTGRLPALRSVEIRSETSLRLDALNDLAENLNPFVETLKTCTLSVDRHASLNPYSRHRGTARRRGDRYNSDPTVVPSAIQNHFANLMKGRGVEVSFREARRPVEWYDGGNFHGGII